MSIREDRQHKVRERKAREDGPGAGRGKSLERRIPGEQRIAHGFHRGRSTDSQREQSPEVERSVTSRDLIVGLHTRQMARGQQTVFYRSVEARHGSRPERESGSGPGEREMLRRENPRSGRTEQSVPGRGRRTVQDVETSKAGGFGQRCPRPVIAIDTL